MMLLVAVVWWKETKGCVSVVTCFLGFSEDGGRVLASSSFQVFLVGCGMPGKEMMKGILCHRSLLTSHSA